MGCAFAEVTYGGCNSIQLAAPKTNKTRPCLIVSSNDANDRRLTVMVVPFSSSPKQHPPFTVAVHCEGKNVSAIVDQMKAVAKERLVGFAEVIAPGELAVVERALRLLLGI